MRVKSTQIDNSMKSEKQYVNKRRSSTEVEIIKKKKKETEILGLQSTMNEILKNAVETINIRLDQAEERFCELEDRPFEVIQSEEKKEKNNKKE